MIRAIRKDDNSFVYIYYIYEAMDLSQNKKNIHYLCSCNNYVGLLAIKKEEVFNMENMKNINYIHINEFEQSAGKNDLIHPDLYFFLKNNWEVYEGIVEGNPDFWRLFEEKLGHRP